VVQKQVVQADRIVARTNVETDRESIRETVRTESVEVVDRGKSDSIRVQGDLAEATKPTRPENKSQLAQSSAVRP
jgi:hypothetical protein